MPIIMHLRTLDELCMRSMMCTSKHIPDLQLQEKVLVNETQQTYKCTTDLITKQAHHLYHLRIHEPAKDE